MNSRPTSTSTSSGTYAAITGPVVIVAHTELAAEEAAFTEGAHDDDGHSAYRVMRLQPMSEVRSVI